MARHSDFVRSCGSSPANRRPCYVRRMRPRIITVTVSDTRTSETDESGPALMEEFAEFRLIRHVIVRDDPDAIRALVCAAAENDEADAVVLTGGTGIAPRDQTYEAIEGLLEKRLDGFGEAYRRLSWGQVGPRAMLSRATAGTYTSCLVFALPGSARAARLGARELIAPMIAHAVEVLRGAGTHARTP